MIKWTIAVLGLSHALFGILLLFGKKGKKSLDFLLMIWLFILSLPFLNEILLNLGAQSGYRFMNQGCTLLHGPLLFLYLREITKHNKFSFLHYWPHLLPFLFFYTILVLRPLPLKPGGSAEPWTGGFSIFRYFGQINLVIFIIYAIISLVFLFKHSRLIKETYAYRNGEISLAWLVFLTVIFILLVIVNILIENSFLRNQISPEVLQLFLFFFFTLYILFFGLRQRRVFPKEDQNRVEKKKKNVNPVNENLLLKKMRDIMESEKLYREPNLSVYDLAQAVNISRHHLSSLLNENLSINFFQFVNQYRLEEVSDLLQSDTENRFNILEMAYESGFNSKSSFNSLFKKEYGITPGQYKKRFQNRDKTAEQQVKTT